MFRVITIARGNTKLQIKKWKLNIPLNMNCYECDFFTLAKGTRSVPYSLDLVYHLDNETARLDFYTKFVILLS